MDFIFSVVMFFLFDKNKCFELFIYFIVIFFKLGQNVGANKIHFSTIMYLLTWVKRKAIQVHGLLSASLYTN